MWELDALRGLALAGVLLVNVEHLVGREHDNDGTHVDPIARFLDLTALESFFSLFAFLFGASFALVAARTDKPYVVLGRRCAFLIPVGLLHQVLMPGEALFWFGVWGALVLLPLVRAHVWQLLLLGALALIFGFAAGGEFMLIPGLFALGSAFARLGLLERAIRAPELGAFFAASVPFSLIFVWWDAHSASDAVMSASGLAGAVTYGTGFLLLLRTRCGSALRAFFVPLGLLSVTNYVSASVLAVAVAAILPLPGFWSLMVLSTAILGVQWWWSQWILSKWRFGPVEWAWRATTWWTLRPART